MAPSLTAISCEQEESSEISSSGRAFVIQLSERQQYRAMPPADLALMIRILAGVETSERDRTGFSAVRVLQCSDPGRRMKPRPTLPASDGIRGANSEEAFDDFTSVSEQRSKRETHDSGAGHATARCQPSTVVLVKVSHLRFARRGRIFAISSVVVSKVVAMSRPRRKKPSEEQ